jgi:hypothetical protein
MVRQKSPVRKSKDEILDLIAELPFGERVQILETLTADLASLNVAQSDEDVTEDEGRRLLDELAQQKFGMSGAEFARRYYAGEFNEDRHSDAALLATLAPLA